MSKKRNNPHKPFMVLNAMLAFAVFVIVCIFLYLSFSLRRDADKVIIYEGKYQIEINSSLSGQSISLYLNDSLLIDETISSEGKQIEVNRFAEENMLMVVDNLDETTIPFNLSKDGEKVIIQKTENGISIQGSISSNENP